MRICTLLFGLHLTSRLLFISIIGFSNNYTLQPDSLWLVKFGMKAAQGNFDFELKRFVASPLYPMLIGGFNLIFGTYWDSALTLFQLFVSALSGVFVYKTALLLFKNRNVGLIASLLFAVFPQTLWFTNTFAQESLFQALFIFTIYYLIKSAQSSKPIFMILAALFFSLSYLTKSHVLLFSIFVPVIYWAYFKFTKQWWLYSSIFAIISFLFSIPYGIYTYKTYGSYMLSSNGSGYQFYLGNTEAGYITIVDVPQKDSEEYNKMKNINLTAGYFNGSESYYKNILDLPQNQKQTVLFKEGLSWIQANPMKFIKLKVYNILLFLMPGVSWRHYSFSNWIFSFLISLPIYLLSYFAMTKLIRERNIAVLPILYIFISMVLFSTIWYTQNRFRTITIEPFYIIYASLILNDLLGKMPMANNLLERISLFFHGTS